MIKFHRFSGTARICAWLVVGVIAAGLGASWGAGFKLPPIPGSSAATNAANTAKVVQADDLLAKFPAGAGLAPKGSRVSIEGQIVDIRGLPKTKPAPKTAKPTTAPVTMPASASAPASTATANQPAPTATPTVRIYLLGKKQNPDDPAHVTCTLDASLESQAAMLKVGQCIQITGTAGEVTAASNRFDLLHCDSLRVIPQAPLSPAEQIIGHWGGILPPNMVGTFSFSADQTVTATFIVNGTQSVTFPGKWTAVEDAKIPTFKLTLDKTDGPVELHLTQNTLHVPSIPPLFSLMGTGGLEFHADFGTPAITDFKAAQAQTLQWLRANTTAPQPQNLVDSGVNFMQKAIQNGDGYLFVVGGGVTRSHKTTMLGAMNATPFMFELTNAQATASGVAMNGMSAKVLRTDLGAMAPEVKIESIVLDNKNAFDPTLPLTGKITLHALKPVAQARYSLLMEYGNGMMNDSFEGGVSLDTETVSFSMPVFTTKEELAAGHGIDNPLALFFTVARDQRVSETIPVLVDVKK